jgi:hypothetical protein
VSTKQSFSCLLRTEERAALRQMAQDAERSESAMVRTLIREAARIRGILAPAQNEGRPRLAQQSAPREA